MTVNEESNFTASSVKVAQTIKSQALYYLGKNNWGNIIAGLFIMILPAIVLYMLFGAIILTAGLLDCPENIVRILGIALDSLYLPVLVFASPLATGFLRMCYKISKEENTGLGDILYFYSGGRFGKCMSINLNIIVRIIGHILLIAIFPVFLALSYKMTGNIVLFYGSILFGVFGLIESFLYCTKYTVTLSVYFEDESIETDDILKLGRDFLNEKDKRKSTRFLLITFSPLILLCFFIVPIIFVVPYICVSLMNNGKWITSLYIK